MFFHAVKNGFQFSDKSAEGRTVLFEHLHAHNAVIRSATQNIDNVLHEDVVRQQKLMASRPRWKKSTMDKFQQNINDHYHTAGVAKAREHVATDQSCPKAWSYRERRDEWRDENMTSELYQQSQGYNVMWSREEAVRAMQEFDKMSRAKQQKEGRVVQTEHPKLQWARERRAKLRKQRFQGAAKVPDPPKIRHKSLEDRKALQEESKLRHIAFGKQQTKVEKCSEKLVARLRTVCYQQAIDGASNTGLPQLH